MRYPIMLSWLMMVLFICTHADAGKYNRLLEVGDQAPAWRELEGIDGKKHSYEDVAAAKFVVVAFTCSSCPYAVDAEDRLIALSDKAAALGGVLVAINVNTIEEDAMPAMRQRAKDKGFNFAYLYDPTQAIANQFGAKTTPEFYVLGPKREVVYMGSLDDSPDGKVVSKRYVESAIDSIVNARDLEVPETVPIGCRIRFARVRGKN